MPATPWEEIVGHECIDCGGPATHWYGDIPWCCQCHGGDIVSMDRAEAIHNAFRRGGLEGLQQFFDHEPLPF